MGRKLGEHQNYSSSCHHHSTVTHHAACCIATGLGIIPGIVLGTEPLVYCAGTMMASLCTGGASYLHLRGYFATDHTTLSIATHAVADGARKVELDFFTI